MIKALNRRAAVDSDDHNWNQIAQNLIPIPREYQDPSVINEGTEAMKVQIPDRRKLAGYKDKMDEKNDLIHYGELPIIEKKKKRWSPY